MDIIADRILIWYLPRSLKQVHASLIPKRRRPETLVRAINIQITHPANKADYSRQEQSKMPAMLRAKPIPQYGTLFIR